MRSSCNQGFKVKYCEPMCIHKKQDVVKEETSSAPIPVQTHIDDGREGNVGHKDQGFERDSRKSPTPHTIRKAIDNPQGIDEDPGVDKTINSNFPVGAATEDQASKLWEGGPKKLVPTKKMLLHLSKYFPGVPQHVIQKTFQSTKQYRRIGGIMGSVVRSRIRAPNPALNVPRRNEEVGTNTIYGPHMDQP
jgi:hypothetical protein